MRAGYQRCLEAALHRRRRMRAQAALVCQRALAYVGPADVPLLPRLPRGAGRRLARAARGLRRCRGLDVAEEPVKDFLNRDIQDTSPRIAYARAVLMGMANPNELASASSPSSPFCSSAGPRSSRSRQAGRRGRGRAAAGGRSRRRRLPERRRRPRRGRASRATSIRASSPRACATAWRCCARASRPPSSRSARTACSPPASSCWSTFIGSGASRRPRAAERRARRRAARGVQRDGGDPLLHLRAASSSQPNEQSELTQKQREEIATFGRVSTRDEDDYSNAQGFLVEQWRIEDESAQGLRLVRKAGAAGQAPCARPAGRRAPGRRRAVHARPGALADGSGERRPARRRASCCPGLPSRDRGAAAPAERAEEKYDPALSLSAVPALKSPPSLVLPRAGSSPSASSSCIGRAAPSQVQAHRGGRARHRLRARRLRAGDGASAFRPRSSCTRSRASLEIAFADGRSFRLPYEFLRVYSPSAEVSGHGPGQEVLQTGKREVEIRSLEPVGSYAVQPVFPTATAPASTPGTTFTSSARTRRSSGRDISPS